ncbi:hypothetical protein AAVH_12754 [Aphelenchoides avenae]|nr:hypothetical protein AAVH_12754 [Aphelenchus avenae]
MALVKVLLLLTVVHAQAYARRYLRSVDPLHKTNTDVALADNIGQGGSLSGSGHEGFHVEGGERQRPMLGPRLRKWGEGYIHMDDMNVKIDAAGDVHPAAEAVQVRR